VAREFLCEMLRQAQTKGVDHLTVDGSLIEARASLKSFQRKDQNNQPPDDAGSSMVTSKR
jgi:hypothetical protein